MQGKKVCLYAKILNFHASCVLRTQNQCAWHIPFGITQALQKRIYMLFVSWWQDVSLSTRDFNFCFHDVLILLILLILFYLCLPSSSHIIMVGIGERTVAKVSALLAAFGGDVFAVVPYAAVGC